MNVIAGRIEDWKSRRFDGLSNKETIMLDVDLAFDAIPPPDDLMDSAAEGQESSQRLDVEPNGPPVKECNRKALVDAFLAHCNAISTIRLFKHHIWKVARYRNRRQFQYWQACDSANTNRSDEATFRRILSMTPETFIEELKRIDMYPEDAR